MIEQIISRRLQIPPHQVQGTVCLLREGATIPLSAATAKEATGSLDEVQVASVKEWLDRLTELETRKQTVLTTIEGQGRLTPELRRRIAECWDAVELEDIYLPYKPKRRTRATVARERGLEPLAEIILAQQSRNVVQSRPGGSFRPKCRPRRRPSPGRATSSPNVSRKTSAPATRCAARSPAKASSIRNSSKAKRRKGRNTPTISTPRRPCAKHLVAPLPGHAPRRGGGHPENRGRRGCRTLHRKSPPAVRTARLGDARMDGSGRGRRVQTPDTPLDRDRTARGGQGEGRRRGDPGFRREPAPTAALLAAGAEARRGHRPGIPHGMQGRGARRAGATCRTTRPSTPIRLRAGRPKRPRR